MKTPVHFVICSVVPVLASVAALPLSAQDGSKDKAPAKVVAKEKPLIQQKAEKIVIPQLEFKDADLDECISFLRRKSQECDKDQDPNKRGVGFINRCMGAKPVTISLKNVSVWEAAQKIAAAAGMEVSPTTPILIHPKGAGPDAKPAAEHEKSAVWKRAERIVIDRVQFFASSPADVCALLKQKSKGADKEGRGIDISAADGLHRPVSLDLRNAKLTDLLTAVAEVTGAEITVSGEKIILKPAKKDP